MKKNYSSLLLASAILLSGAATDALANKTTLHQDFMKKGELPGFDFAFNAFKPEKKKRAITNKVDRSQASDASALEGTWTFMVGDNYLEGGKGYTSIEFTATVDENNKVTFSNPDFYPLTAQYNSRTHSLTFNKRLVATEEDNFIFQVPFIYDWPTGTMKKGSVRAYYNEYEGAIVFDDNIAIALAAYGDKNANELKGYYDILDMSLSYLPTAGDWTDLGEALFTDAWLAPGFSADAAAATYSVPVQQNAENKNIYRLVNPYKYGPLAIENECERDGYIVFDVTDPAHVVFKFADAGFANKSKRIDNFFVYNYMGGLVLINPYYTAEEVINEFGSEFPATTYRDGVLTFDTSMAMPDVRFALQDLANSTRFWQDAEGKPVVRNASIVLPGYDDPSKVNGIEAAEADAEYFNAQGLRVINPEPGQIVIKRQGNTVTKEIFK